MIALVSACLAGLPTRYDGSDRLREGVLEALEASGYAWVPVCPEQLGGLPTPRPPCWLRGGDGRDAWAGRAAVVTAGGEDLTGAFLGGARAVAALARRTGARLAVLEEGSPSCGVHRVHVDGRETAGRGVTAAALEEIGVQVLAPDEIETRGQAPARPATP